MQGCICKLQADDAVERLMKSVAQEVGLGLFETLWAKSGLRVIGQATFQPCQSRCKSTPVSKDNNRKED